MGKEIVLGDIVRLEAKIIGFSNELGERYVRLSKEEGKSILVPDSWLEIIKPKPKGGEIKDVL